MDCSGVAVEAPGGLPGMIGTGVEPLASRDPFLLLRTMARSPAGSEKPLTAAMRSSASGTGQGTRSSSCARARAVGGSTAVRPTSRLLVSACRAGGSTGWWGERGGRGERSGSSGRRSESVASEELWWWRFWWRFWRAGGAGARSAWWQGRLSSSLLRVLHPLHRRWSRRRSTRPTRPTQSRWDAACSSQPLLASCARPALLPSGPMVAWAARAAR